MPTDYPPPTIDHEAFARAARRLTAEQHTITEGERGVTLLEGIADPLSPILINNDNVTVRRWSSVAQPNIFEEGEIPIQPIPPTHTTYTRNNYREFEEAMTLDELEMIDHNLRATTTSNYQDLHDIDPEAYQMFIETILDNIDETKVDKLPPLPPLPEAPMTIIEKKELEERRAKAIDQLF